MRRQLINSGTKTLRSYQPQSTSADDELPNVLLAAATPDIALEVHVLFRTREYKVHWKFRSQRPPEGEGAVVKNQKVTGRECGLKGHHQVAQEIQLPPLLTLLAITVS
jgi:hypothetical protein